MDQTHSQILYFVFGIYALLLCIAAVLDTWKFIIPNVITVALIALFVATALYMPFDADWLSHLGAGAAVFAGGAVLYAMNKLGGGDVKLLAAISVWAGFEHLPDLLLYVALGGGALAIGLIVVRRAIMSLRVAGAGGDTTSLPRVLLEGEAVPYGLAIAPSAILIGRDLPHLGAFLFP